MCWFSCEVSEVSKVSEVSEVSGVSGDRLVAGQAWNMHHAVSRHLVFQARLCNILYITDKDLKP